MKDIAATAASAQRIELGNEFTDDLLIDRDYGRVADLHEDVVQRDLVSGMEVHGLENRKIGEAWNHLNFLGLLQQVGAVSPMDELAASRSDR